MRMARNLQIRNRYRNRKKNFKTSRRISKSGIRNPEFDTKELFGFSNTVSTFHGGNC
jgi:hypothetical protein